MLKRIFDFIFAIILTIILSPLLLIIAIAIKVDSHGKALFRQKRMGQHGEPFIVYKFRTMYKETPKNKASHELDDRDSYITKIGYWLRVTSLDELPQLFNIIKGEMSLVGPRPVILTEEELIEKRKENGIYKLKPGVTGYAQINGRDHVDIDEKVELDKYYLENHSLLIDLNIILKTGIKVLKREDIFEHQKENKEEKVEENFENN
ncbi:O-antigen biosynthesis protein WbqP [Halanaerobium sp. DL-01]|uniref:sugar transferase n=1 Tax=Halanaerobium sp. DL-01 TaxID=1653064 RepID=UPI000DF13D7D|nr:sugar transferase [Halanaerobium sp. DL-01]RCW78354.1 O-antigen biosynthesis protein WbqP [Halanaerobium sp. DL-01]